MNISVRNLKLALCLLVFAFLLANQSKQTLAQTPAIQLQLQTSGLSRPVYVTNARDSRLFIVEQDGRIKILQNGSLLSTPFLDITSLVTSGGEQGLLGLAFHPNYPATPYFFVHFTSDGDALPDGTVPNVGDNVIVRYNVSGSDANLANPTSGKTLLVMPQPFSNHNGGMIEFGNDGYLYIAKGDGGSGNDPGNRAQNINEILGKILRIDVNQNVNVAPYHGIPPTNPFVSTSGRDEIFLIGLRNPWRFSFDRPTGDLWIGDVGQSVREEIDRIVFDGSEPGRNLGWRAYEGTICTGLNPEQCAGGSSPIDHTPPIAEYGHTGGRCSITGGYVYRGNQIPSLVGSYVYADYCTGEIFRLQGTTQQLLLDNSFNITSFGEDSLGELYVTSSAGTVYKILPLTTSATVSISGQVRMPKDMGVSAVLLTLSGGNLTEPRTTTTDKRGFYEFQDVEIGETYVITARSRSFIILPANRTYMVLDELTNVDFDALIPFIKLPIWQK